MKVVVKIYEVNIDGNAWEIPDKEINSRPALQGEDGLFVDKRQYSQEQFGLFEVYGVNHADIP